MSKRGKAKDKSQARQAVGQSKESAFAKHAAVQGFPSGPTPTPYTGNKPPKSGAFDVQAGGPPSPLASNASEPNKPKGPNRDDNIYTNKKIENFDTTAGGAGSKKGTERISRQDLMGLYEQGGFSKQEIIDYANSYDGDGPGARGGKAQKLLAKWTSELSNKPGEGNKPPGADDPVQTTQPADPGKPNPTVIENVNTDVKPTPYTPPGTAIGSGNSQEQTVDQTISQDRNFGDVNNTIGDGNTIIGSNLGNQDFSVNIGMNQNSQNMGGGSGSGAIPQVDPLANMMGAQAYAALNDNAWAKSQAMMNGTTQAATASQLNETLNGTNAKVGNYDYASRMNAQNMLMMGRQMTNDTLGDIWSFQAPEWQMPEAPSKIESNAEEIGEEYSKKIEGVSI